MAFEVEYKGFFWVRVCGKLTEKKGKKSFAKMNLMLRFDLGVRPIAHWAITWGVTYQSP